MSERRKDAIAIAIFTAIPTLLFLDVVLGIHGFFLRDIAHFFYPAKKIVREIVLGGHFPYWNPWFEAGQPLAANPQYGVFYPPNWLMLLPGFGYLFHLLPILHLHLAAFGTYALLRSMNAGRPAATFAAVAFSIGGLSLSALNLLPILFSMAWLPLVCLYARRFLLHRQRRDFALAALFLAMQLLIGEPVTALQSGILLGIYALHRGMRNVAWIGAISAAAVLAAAIQVLPMLDLVGDSIRARGFSFEHISQWSLPPLRLGELVYPHFLGNGEADDFRRHYAAYLYGERRTPYLFSLYPGLLVTALAAAGVMARVRGWTLFLAVFATSIVLAIGSHTPLLRLVYDAGVQSIRYPEKFMLMAVFACVVFGARTLDELLRGSERVRRSALLFGAVTTAVAAIALLTLHTSLYEPLLRRIARIPHDVDIGWLLGASRVQWTMAVLRGVLLLLLIRNVFRARPMVWRAAAALFLTLDLGSFSHGIAPRVSRAFYDTEPQVLRHFPAPENRDDFRVFHLANWAASSKAARFYRAQPAGVYELQRNGLFPAIGATYRLRLAVQGDYDLTALLPTGDFTDAMWALDAKLPGGWLNYLAAMSNVRYVGVYRRPDDPLAAREPVRFLEGHAYPRYYFATQVVPMRDDADFVAKLATGRYDRQAAFVKRAAMTPARAAIHSQREWPNGARLEVEADGHTFLVMSVTPHKYWTVTIDGKETNAVVTNVGYQGVAVPRGRHVVEMRYRNPRIAAGAAISAAALLALAFCTIRRQ